jgi:hypothetical protein
MAITLNSTRRRFFKSFLTVCFIAVICFISACTTKTPDENGLIGIWKHSITSNVQIDVKGKNASKSNEQSLVVSYERLRLKADKTFTFGEYSAKDASPYYEVHGKWQLRDNKAKLEFIYEDGERGIFVNTTASRLSQHQEKGRTLNLIKNESHNLCVFHDL